MAVLAASNLPSAADGFDPNVNGNVYALARQPDGKLIVGGAFSTLSPNGGTAQGRGNLARVSADGTLDANFNPATDGQVNAVVVQADGKVVVGGTFTTIAGVARNKIARLNPGGSVDTAFNPNVSGDGIVTIGVNALALQADGKILVGGAFSTIGGAARNRIARLNADGTADAFNPNANNVVNAIAVQADGKVVIGGGFTTLQPNGDATATSRNRAARLFPNGAIDAAFDPAPNNLVSAITIQANGSLVMGGSFTSVQPSGAAAATVRNHVARFNNDGTLDTAFDPNASGNVTAVAFQADGKILLGGAFTRFVPSGSSVVDRAYFARLNLDGTIDRGFIPGANNAVSALVVQPDGAIVAGGYFTQLLAGTTLAIATSRNRLARVSADGTLDITFNPDARGAVLTQAVQGNGQILVGGSFSSVGGATRTGIARLDANGSVDSAFSPNPNSRVDGIAVQGDGKILVAGAFTRIAGETRSYFARLNADGSLDAAFNPTVSGNVNAVVVQGDGKILVGGNFSTVQPNGAASATVRNSIARLNADGSVDTAFDPNANGQVSAMVVQADNKIVIAGSFSALAPNGAQFGTARSFVARLNADGTLDTSYNPNPNSFVTGLALQSDGKIVIGGAFSAFLPEGDLNSTLRNRVARITTAGKLDAFDPNVNSTVSTVSTVAVQPDQKILVGGGFRSLQPAGTTDPVFRNYLVRLNADGTVDAAFDPNPNGLLRTILAQADGRILVGGTFSALRPSGGSTVTSRLHFARLAGSGAVDTAFDPALGGQSGGQVNAIAMQANGRFIIAGSIGEIGGATSSNLTRFNPDSTPDDAFTPDADGPINALAVRPNSEAVATQSGGFAFLNADGSFRAGFTPGSNVRLVGQVFTTLTQPDNKIILGGAFVNTTGATGRNLIRFLPDGTLDTTFNPNPDGAVYALAMQPDMKILVGGGFVNLGGVARNRIARIDGGGSPDTFDPNASGSVNTLIVQPDGKILMGGVFTTLQPNGATTTTTRTYLARVNADGTLDTGFNPSPNAQVLALALQANGQVIAGGAFTFVAPGGTTAVARNYVARLNADGTLDTGFDPNANSTVQALALLPGGGMLVGGSFTTINGSATPYLARLFEAGGIDTSLARAPNAVVSALSLQADGKVLLGGQFTAIDNVPRNRVARLNADNSLDTTFNPNADGVVATITTQADSSILLGGAFGSLRPLGAIYVGGSFANIGSAAVSNLALLNDDGSASTGFRPSPNGVVFAISMQPDGRAIVGGNFTTIANAARNRLARLNADATLEAGFNPNANAQVNAIALQPDGKILVGGAFTAIAGAGRERLARLNADGSVDGFNPGVNGSVNVVAVQADGRVLVGGAFTSVGGATRNRLARLNADGSIDGTFNPNPDGAISSLVVQADGQILVGGSFGSIGGAARSNLARLNADGSADAGFDPGADGAVLALGLAVDGKLLVGGTFNTVSGLPRSRFARLAATSGATQSLTADASSVTWNRGESAPELAGVIFEQSSDAIAWTSLGQGARVGGTSSWQRTGLSLPSSSVYYVRARGIVASTQYASSGLVESVRLMAIAPGNIAPAIIGGSVGSAFYYAVSSATGGATFAASGLPAGLNISASTGIISGVPTVSGSYPVAVSTTNGGGTSMATVTIVVGVASGGNNVDSRMVSLSARGPVTNASPLIAGFVINGSESKTLLFRGVGPTLTTMFGLQGVAAPELRLYNSSGQLLLSGGRWQGDPALAAVFATVGAFPLPVNNADAAIVTTLQPGVYTVQVVDPTGTGGVALAEIYDVTTTAAPRLVNISARGTVNTGDGVLIGGLVITGTSAKQVLVRAGGPALVPLGVPSALADPVIAVFNGQLQVIARNDDWETPVTVSAAYPGTSSAGITVAAASTGAFPFVAGSKDSAIVLTLAPGSYTIQVSGAGSTSGVSLVEIYELP